MWVIEITHFLRNVPRPEYIVALVFGVKSLLLHIHGRFDSSGVGGLRRSDETIPGCQSCCNSDMNRMVSVNYCRVLYVGLVTALLFYDGGD